MSEPTPPPVPPVPKYGEYAPGYVPPPAPAPGADPAAPTAARPRKVWDLVLTIVLLVLGLFGMLLGVIYGMMFTDPELINQVLQQQGYGGITDAGSAPAVLIVSHVVLYLIAVGGALPLLITRRVAFWVPLAAGVLAAIIFWSTLVGVIMTDPAISTQF
jgi:hypothetical protein